MVRKGFPSFLRPALAATLSGALLAVAPAVPARAADDGEGPIVAYTFDADDLAKGVIADSSGHGD